MGKFLVTLGTGTGMGAVMQCASVTAMINNMPIAVVGDIATHPYGPDTLVEGIPTILLNGKPVCFSTAKTSKGGVVLPNTTVKISSPTFNSYTGIVHSARVESHLCFEETEDEEVLAKQQKEQENEEPVKCTEIKLYSDFAWQQFINLAENDPVCMFKHRISEIFGNDILEDAVDKLRAACKDRSITNPEIEVCENRIHGLLAAYHTKTNKIYVSRQFIENSLDDNDNKHMLMAALIEEFGHHVDWLLRCKYDKNVNDDAEGDEGARFAYKSMYHIYEIDYRELQEIAFATVETNEGSYDLKWDLNELLDILDTYTRDRQYGDRKSVV